MQINDLCSLIRVLCLRLRSRAKEVNEMKTLLNKFDWPRLIDT